MPIFVFECQRCGHKVERICSRVEQADETSVWCDSPNCKPAVPGGVCRMVRVPGVANFALRGAGFHVNDYPRGK